MKYIVNNIIITKVITLLKYMKIKAIGLVQENIGL